MGASLQWRQPPERENHLHGEVVQFGRGRSRGTGYLAHSNRVGPGVLLLDASGQERADVLNAQGFTSLVPRLPADRDPGPLLAAAAEFLSVNWHPRLAVMAVGTDRAPALSALVEARTSLDLVVLLECPWVGAALPSMPVVGHFSSEGGGGAVRSFFSSVAESTSETELYIYEDTHEGFCERRSKLFSPEACALAEARTIDALEYHLS